jgi:hypothetical protein
MGWAGIAPCAPVVRLEGQGPDLEQLESERFDLGEYAVQRGLVRKSTPQDGVPGARLSLKGRKRQPRHLPQVAANPELVAVRRLPIQSLTGHRVTERTPRMNPPCVAEAASKSALTGYMPLIVRRRQVSGRHQKPVILPPKARRRAAGGQRARFSPRVQTGGR